MNERKPPRGTVRTTVYLPEALHKQARIYAVRHDTSLTQLILEGLKLRLKDHPVEEAAGD